MTGANPYAAWEDGAYEEGPAVRRADYAVLGVGTLAAAIVTGLCEGVSNPPRILLSPRSADRSGQLSAVYPTVSVARDNQDLVDGSRVVVVCIRPQDADAVLPALRFREDQVVISAMAAVSLGRLEDLVAPATRVCRVVPQVYVAQRASSTHSFPAPPEATSLFSPLGGLTPVADEGALDGVSVASATVAAFLAYVAQIVDWLESKGLDGGESARHVASVFAQLADDLGTIRSVADLREMAQTHSTKGGLNQRFEEALRQAGVLEEVVATLDRLRASLGDGLS